MIQPTIINLHRNEYGQGLYYYSFSVNLGRCVRNCNTLNDLCNKLCVPDKTRFKHECFQYDYRNK